MCESGRGTWSFAAVLQVAFIVLKLGGVIGWSWWWVFSPLWVSFAAVVAVFVMLWLLAKMGEYYYR